MVKMVLNSKYRIHSNLDRSKDGNIDEEEYRGDDPTTSELFIIKGKPDFSDTNLREYGWKVANALSPKDKKNLENTPGYKDYKETILYRGPQGNAVLHANYRKNRHKLGINLNKYQNGNPEMMELVKSMFEREWECKLEEGKHNISKLEKEVRPN